MRRYIFATFAILATDPAYAACFGDAGTPLFHCTLKQGQAEARVCLQDGVAYYAYGPTGAAPDILLARSVTDIEMSPWPGVGRTIFEDLTFTNGAYGYRLAHQADKFENTITGGLSVLRDGAVVAELTCDPDSVTVGEFYPLYEAKEAAGQCWDRDASVWGDC